MGSRPIQVGDWVMVVRAHCPGSSYLGRIRIVTHIAPMSMRCSRCGGWMEGIFACIGDFRWGPVSWLRRIDPQTLLEAIEPTEAVRLLKRSKT